MVVAVDSGYFASGNTAGGGGVVGRWFVCLHPFLTRFY